MPGPYDKWSQVSNQTIVKSYCISADGFADSSAMDLF